MRRTIKEEYRTYIDGEKIEVLFMFQAGTVWASMDSVYQSCLKDERFDVKLALVEDTTVETSHMIGARRFLEETGIDFCFYKELDFHAYCPHVVFIQFPYDVAFHTPETLSIQFKIRGTRVVYIPYGIEISDTEISRKDHFHNFVVENAWRIYTCSDGIKAEYEKYCHNRMAVRVCGSPKFDAIMKKTNLPLKKEIVFQSNGRKNIVWKMHFPKKIREKGQVFQITPYVEEYIKFAEQIDTYDEFFFIILAHPKMLKGVVASDIQGDDSLMKQVQELISTLEKKENVYIDADDDYRNSFYHADAIIMDRSAVMIEAAMLDVPVLMMRNKDYCERMTVPVENVINCFCQGFCCEDMQNFMESYKAGKDFEAEKRKNAIQENFPFNDGLCGERIKEDIAKNVLKESKTGKIKVVLYGSGAVCSYYMEQQRWGSHSIFEVCAVVDSDEKKWGVQYYGIIIISPETLLQLDFDAIVIMTEPHYFEIKRKLVYDLFLDERKIWRLDEFVVALEEN